MLIALSTTKKGETVKNLLIILAIIFTTGLVSAEEKKIQWTYNRVPFDKLVGFRLYKGPNPDAVTERILDVQRGDVEIISEKPVHFKETFDTDPGDKYKSNVKNGSWKWEKSECDEENSMKVIPGGDGKFMVVFDVPAGTANEFLFSFWPLSSRGDQPMVYSYLKDEALPGYYELRYAGADGTRSSNWRKVYNEKWGGVEGAFELPKYDQCQQKDEGLTCCATRKNITLKWKPDEYIASITKHSVHSFVGSVSGTGVDKQPMDITKFEIIFHEQSGWLDNIVIGGRMVVQSEVDIVIDSERTWLAVSAYRIIDGKVVEGPKSLAGEYKPTSGTAGTRPLKPATMWIIE